MNISVELCLIPIGTGPSLSDYIAECHRVILESGLEPKLHAFGTNLEGDWDKVMNAVKTCHERVHAMGVVRIHSSLKLGSRTDKNQSLSDKVDSVNQKVFD